MPYKSQIQRRYFHAALAAGKIMPETVAEFDKASEGMKLPKKAGSKTTKNPPFRAALGTGK